VNILDAFRYASLATAAYVRLGGSPWEGATFVTLASSEEQDRLPLSIATELFNPADPNASRWTIAHYYSGDVPGTNDDTGFAATLFKREDENVLAIRGVDLAAGFREWFKDLVGASAGGIGLLGVAVTQVVDMINLIQRLYGAGMVTQLSATLTLTRPDEPGAHFIALQGSLPSPRPIPGLPGIPIPMYLSLSTFQAPGEKRLEPGDKITLTGHSLGGHLAMVAAQLFGDRINPDVYLFNSAGFDPVSVNVASAAASLSVYLGPVAQALITGAKVALAESLGSKALFLSSDSQQASSSVIGGIRSVLGTPAGAFTVHNLESEDSSPGNDFSVVASVFTGAGGLGTAVLVGTEVNSHSIEQIMDALALHAVFYRLDDTLTLEKIKKFVDAVEKVPGRSEEVLTEALHALLIAGSRFARDGLQLSISDASAGVDVWTDKGDITARDAYHTAILELNRQLDEGDLENIQVVSLINEPSQPMTSQQLIDRATYGPDEHAYRYALKKLLPFSVTGIDYQTLHNFSGELELYDRQRHSGTLTTDWIKDRAEFLYWKNVAFRGDTDLAYAAETPDQMFVDLHTRSRVFTTTVTVEDGLQKPIDPPRFVFGGDYPDFVTGGKESDRLYGGAGTDFLAGFAGNDRLEGGQGFDVYQYGALRTTGPEGNVSDSNDGLDTILDTDGRGVLRYVVDDPTNPQEAAVIADARVKVSDAEWKSTDGRFAFFKAPNEAGLIDLRVEVLDGPGGSMILKDWREGDFGIRLGSDRGATEAPSPVRVVTGDRKPEVAEAIVPATEDGRPANVQPEWRIVAQTPNELESSVTVGLSEVPELPGNTRIVSRTTNFDSEGNPVSDTLALREVVTFALTFNRADDLGNLEGTDPEPDRPDVLYGSEGSDVIISLGGNDQVHAKGGADLIFGGTGSDVLDGDAGDDRIYGEAGKDRLRGGTDHDDLFGGLDGDILNGMEGKDRLAGEGGRDLLFGDDGNDELYADDMVEAIGLAAAIRNGETQSGSGIQGEWLDGGEGDDLALGGAGDDQLMGGGGNDVLIGGGGDDNLNGDRYGISVDPDFWRVEREIVSTDGLRLFREQYNAYIQYAESANGGDDLIYGGAGADWMFGWVGQDLLDGGDGDDIGFGGAGDDILMGGAGADELSGDNGDNSGPGADFLDGGSGADILWGNDGNDILIGGHGNDELYGGSGDDVLFGGAGTDVLKGGAGQDTYVFESVEGKEQIDDVPDNAPGSVSERSILVLGDGLEREDFKFRQGSLMLDFGEGNEIHFLGFDRDDPWSTAVLGEIQFSDGTFMTFQDVLDQGFELDGTEGDDNGEEGAAPMLVGTAVNDRIHGHAGDDILAGMGGNDVLDGGDGADMLQGGAGDDAYVADGTDTIFDMEGRNSLAFADSTTVFDVEIGRFLIDEAAHWALSIGGHGFLAINADQPAFDLFTFSDDSSYSLLDLLGLRYFEGQSISGGEGNDAIRGYGGNDYLEAGSGNDVVLGYGGGDFLAGGDGNDELGGGAGSDILQGDSGDDVLDGGMGDDTLEGGDGSDVYVFGTNSGYDSIIEEGSIGDYDVVVLDEGLSVEGASFERLSNGNLAISLDYGSAGFEVEGYYANQSRKIEAIVFSDETVIEASFLDSLEVPPITGTGEADEIVGTEWNDTIEALEGDDVLDGASGSDLLRGGDGADTYLYTRGTGQDTLTDGSGVNRIRLGFSISFSDVGARRIGNDLSLDLRGTGDRFLVQGYFDAPQNWTIETADGEAGQFDALIAETQRLDSDEFARVAAFSEAVHRGSFISVFQAQGYQLVDGTSLARRYATPALVTYVDGVQTNTTTYTFFVNPDNPSVSTQTFNLDAWNYEDSGTVQDNSVSLQKQLIISDAAVISGTVQNIHQIGNEWVWASTGWSEIDNPVHRFSTDSSVGFISGQELDPQTGQYLAVGTVRTVREFNYNTGSAQSYIIELHPGESFPAPHYSALFPDKSLYEWMHETSIKYYSEVRAGNSDNQISGAFIVDAGGGNDVVWGSVIVNGGEGDDILTGGDYLFGGSGNDELYWAYTMKGGPGDDRLAGGTEMDGGEGDDRLFDGSILSGGFGNDLLDGGQGADLYLINSGDLGVDLVADSSGGSTDDFLNAYYVSIGLPDWRHLQRITTTTYRIWGGEGPTFDTEEQVRNFFLGRGMTFEEAYARGDVEILEPLPPAPRPASNDFEALEPYYQAGAIDLDTVGFAEGVAIGNLTFSWGRQRINLADRDNEQEASDHVTLDIARDSSKTVRVVIPRADDPIGSGVEQFRFADGAVLTLAEMMALAPPAPDFDPPPIVTGTEGADEVFGTDADDILYGLSGDDSLSGGEGNDELIGGVGNDQLYGGSGDDLLSGGEGNDIYVYEWGDGVDQIFDHPSPGESNTLHFGEGIAPDAISLGQGSLVIRIGNDQGAIHLGSFDPINPLVSRDIDLFVFADGTVWDYLALLSLGIEVSGGPGADFLQGTAVADRIFGFEGADRLDGRGGNDFLAGGEGGDVYLFGAGSGHDEILDEGGAGGVDAIELTMGIVPSMLEISKIENDLLLAIIGSDDAIRVRHWEDPASQIEEVRFADGVIWGMDVLRQLANEVNRAPVLNAAIPDQTVQEDELVGFRLPERAFLDPDAGDELTYSVNLADGSTLPVWLEFDFLTLTFRATALNADVGTISVNVTATDSDGMQASDRFDVTVINTNDAPVAANDVLLMIEDEILLLNAGTLISNDVDEDPTQDALEIVSLGDVYHGSAVLGADDGVVFVPESNYSGAAGFTYLVGDGNGGFSIAAVEIWIEAQNDAPVLAAVPVDQRALEDRENSFRLSPGTFVEVDAGDNLDYAVQLSGGEAIPAWLVFDPADLSFMGAPGNEDVGTLSIRVTAIDDSGASAYVDFQIDVENVNDAPMLGTPLPDVFFQEGIEFALSVPDGAFVDIDQGDIFSYGATLVNGDQLPAWLTFDPGTLTLQGTPDAAAIGSIEVQVEATDLGGASIRDDFILTVEPAPGLLLNGTGDADNLIGQSGNDVINGLEGADTMTGKLGDDQYYVDNSGDVVSELPGQGIDTVFSSVAYRLPENVENLTLVGTKSTGATGNSLDNTLVGNDGWNVLDGGFGNDFLDGGAGADILAGGKGDDAYVVDNGRDVVVEKSGAGMDTVRSHISYALGPNIENLVLLGTSAIKGTGNTSDNLLTGNSAANVLSGSRGSDILQGEGGNDTLSDSNGNALFDGGEGGDSLSGGGGEEMYIGGPGDDRVDTGGGADIIAFNAGDGQDVVVSGTGRDDTLSLGGGIRYSDLGLSKSGKDLILHTGGMDRLTFKDWYAGANHRTVVGLQVIVEAMAEFDSSSAQTLYDNKVETFDFRALASAFDAAGRVNGWALTNALLNAHLSGSDTAAMGGDLAYQYGLNGSLSGIGLTPAQDVLKAAQFGTSPQALRPLQDLQQGQLRLA